MKKINYLKENGKISLVAPSFGCATEPYKTRLEFAISNLEKYLELSPNAEDKDDVEELIKSCQKEDTPEKQVVLEG